MKLIVTIGGRERVLEVTRPRNGTHAMDFSIDSAPMQADIQQVEPGIYSILAGTRSAEARIEQDGDGYLVTINGNSFPVAVRDPRRRDRSGRRVNSAGLQQITSPMPGKVVRVMVKAGDRVSAGAALFVVEAMKMQNEIKSPKDGVVTLLEVEEGSPVSAGAVMAVIE